MSLYVYKIVIYGWLINVWFVPKYILLNKHIFEFFERAEYVYSCICSKARCEMC